MQYVNSQTHNGIKHRKDSDDNNISETDVSAGVKSQENETKVDFICLRRSFRKRKLCFQTEDCSTSRHQYTDDTELCCNKSLESFTTKAKRECTKELQPILRASNSQDKITTLAFEKSYNSVTQSRGCKTPMKKKIRNLAKKACSCPFKTKQQHQALDGCFLKNKK